VRSRARGVLLSGTLGLLVMGADCGPPRRPEIRQGSKSYLFNITSDPIPPHAREDVIYTVTVRDRESGQPIETGEGRIFANTLEGARTYDGFTKAPAIGTYTAKLRFVASGQWAIGIQFHSDSTKPLEKTEWMQDVLQERPGIN
jgi:hypothetical protein